MISVNTYNQKGEVIEKTQLPEEVFGVKWNADLVHQAVVAQMANARQVLAHTKDKGEVRGGESPGGKKARAGLHGSIRSPLWKGGGVTFGPTKARNFAKKINKKMKRKALFMALSSKLRDKEMIVLDELVLEKSKTKEISGILVRLFNQLKKLLPERSLERGERRSRRPKVERSQDLSLGQAQGINFEFKKDRSEILLVLPQKSQHIQRASQNLPYLKTILADSLNVVDVLKYRHLVIIKEAIGIIKKHYLKA